MEPSQGLEAVRHYYSQVLQSTQDLKTSACCAAESIPPLLRPYVERIHDEVKARFYGCGIIAPPCLEGLTVLDLGCGSGRDVYMLAQLVGEKGKIIGVDMTDEQLVVARKHKEFHRRSFGYAQSNVEFHKGYIEDLTSLGIADASVDLVISNCVVNLSPDKERVFAEVLRVLKPGGELYFSDVYCDRRLPSELQSDPVLLGECLGGALYVQDFRRMMNRLGVRDFRVVSQNPIVINDPAIAEKLGAARFNSISYRIFKLDLEDQCEDYGQLAVYRGNIAHNTHSFTLDDHHVFERGRPMLVCRNTADMLSKTRYAEYFTVTPPSDTHFGLFPCGPATSTSNVQFEGGCC